MTANNVQTLSKTLESKIRVQYEDCDPFNHLNNSKYIDYIMGARTEQLLDHYKFDVSELAYTQRIGWVAAQTQISYFYPASWMEMVTIETRLIRFSQASLVVEGLLWDENKARLKSLMWCKLVHFDLQTQRSNKHSEELMNLFGEIHYAIEGNETFDDRVRTIRM